MKHSISISEVKIEKRFRKDIDDRKSLTNDIVKRGLLQPIIISTDNVLIAGLRRLKSCEELGWKIISCKMIDLKNNDAKLCEISENTERKNFTISDIIGIAEYVEKTRIGHRPKKGVQIAPLSDNKNTDQKKGAQFGYLPKGNTKDIVAKLANISTGQADKIISINKSIKKSPKKYKSLLEDIESKKKSVNTVYQKIQLETRKPSKVKIPKGQWNVFEFDWPMGYKNQSIGVSGTAGSKIQYEVVPPIEILEIEIPKFKKIIAKNAVVFMWVTVPLLNEVIQLQILETLGFSYKTMISWHKLIPKNIFGGKGLGYWFTGEMEHCIVGVRGEIDPFRCRLPNFIEAPLTKHSEKPIAFKELFEEATKNIPHRKMFEGYARRKREGWTGFGNQL